MDIPHLIITAAAQMGMVRGGGYPSPLEGRGLLTQTAQDPPEAPTRPFSTA